MKTIVKGKNMKNNYEHDYSDCYFSFINPFEDNNYIRYLYRDLNYHRSAKIKEIPELISYETYFESGDILYRLHVGEEFENNIIEKVEGTENGDIIYYTDKVLSIDENEENKIELKNKLDNVIQNIEDEIRKAYDEKNEKKWWQFWRSDK